MDVTINVNLTPAEARQLMGLPDVQPAISCLIVVLSRHGWAQIPKVPTVGLSVIGAALSILAAFRNSASYERWWEARKIAGSTSSCAICRVRPIATSRKSLVTI